ncbi:MAG: transporter substrate-binding domain-containing protein [Bacteroidetes bacterium]|nr:transporter substrate-binding domain-containing protein [Bacteroidota bacterium]MDA1120713.1 transporter substrate-binding domain-containing protein [Bacteroidota bacterium]
MIRKGAHSLLMLTIVALGACHEPPKSVEITSSPIAISPIDFDLDSIIKRGSLRVIIDNSSTGYFIYKGQPMGYEYDLLDLFSREIGVTLEFLLTTNLPSTFDLLDKGDGDIIAYSLTVTKERKNKVSFTQSHIQARQMLVQRKPQNWRDLKLHEIEKQLIRNPLDLVGKSVHVRPSSSYAERLRNLSGEIGDDIQIVEDYEETTQEELIEMVSNGSIDYTIADEHIAMVNATYYLNIDVKTPISFPQNIAWAVRKNSTNLLEILDHWIDRMKKTPDYYVIFNKYFKNPKIHLARVRSDYSNIFSGNKISPYDALIKATAQDLNWDWKLLAAQIYQESKFDPKARSWAGAIGLMQMIPETGMAYGVVNLENPANSLKSGASHIKWLNDYWKKKVPDSLERTRFILGSYNAGHGHVLDAYRLTEKYKGDQTKWNEVAQYLLKKSKTQYFNDPVVNFGYCLCQEPVQYVENILYLFDQYSTLIGEDAQIRSSS